MTGSKLADSHRRLYQSGGITIRVESDLPITDTTFHPKLGLFEVEKPGDEIISIHHHFSLPDLTPWDLGREIYRRAPWAIRRAGDSYIYLGISPDVRITRLLKVVVFNTAHTRGEIYNESDKDFLKGGLQSLTLFPTDQILLARVLADRQGCYLHSSGLVLDGAGLLFVGHSDAGKSTMVKMLQDRAEILCDDRIIVRKWPEGFRIYGTWSHGEVPLVSPSSAPLKAILFLHKSKKNQLVRVKDRAEIVRKLLPCIPRGLVTPDWWAKTLALMDHLAAGVPFYEMHFDKSGRIVPELENLARGGSAEG